jgi:LysM repeat protein
LNQTRTPASQETQPATSQTPGTGTRTPTTGTPTGSRTPTTGTPAGGGDRYTVQAGDFCGTIAADHDITLQELLDANDMTEADCNNLQIGEVLIIP